MNCLGQKVIIIIVINDYMECNLHFNQKYEETEGRSFLFGYEESYGYFIGEFVWNKNSEDGLFIDCRGYSLL